jgi:predicted phosphodiesterase
MRIALISDVHANEIALGAVLAQIAACGGADELWSLGDETGYGARPNEVVSTLERICALRLAGNHDLVVTHSASPFHMRSREALRGVRHAQAELSEACFESLAGLRPEARRHGVACYHGSPDNPAWGFVGPKERDGARESLLAADADILCVGHTHIPYVWQLDGGELRGVRPAPGATIELAPKAIVNPGSVSAPPSRPPIAWWCLLDLAARAVTFRSAAYSGAAVHQQYLDAGLAR